MRDGGLVDADVMSRIDSKLVSDLMTEVGVAFSEAAYSVYLKVYERVFGSDPDYSIAADNAAYARVERELDALWMAWSSGQPLDSN